MKINKTLTSLLSLVAITSLAYASGTISEESLGLRKSDLYSESKTAPSEAKFDAPAPGAAKTLQRAYDNAPPLIPHSVDGLLPITAKNNACLGCHMPEAAKGVGATPIPPSHFVNFRPVTKVTKDGAIVKEGKKIKNTSDIKVVEHKQKTLYQGRYNCSQCHVPQANVKPLVKNNFKPDYQSDSAKKKSNLLDVLNKGVDIK